MEDKIADDNEPIHLYMSGGGHRAGFGCIGVISALVYFDRWRRVTQVTSVSGGSMINGALVSNRAIDDDSTYAAMRAMWRQMIKHGIKPWSTRARLGGLIGIMALLGVLVLGIMTVLWGKPFGIGPTPRWLTFILGALVVPVAVSGGRMAVSVYFREFIAGSIAGPKSGGITTLEQGADLPRQHIFCATGRVTSVPYYLVTDVRAADFSWGSTLHLGYSVADAAWASSSLPGLESVRAPAESEREILVDGGASGMFGEQINSRLERSADDALGGGSAWARNQRKLTPGTPGSTDLVIDAGSHAKPPSKRLRRLGRLSMIYVLGRWVKASMEATFVNDLHDFQGNRKIRITETGRIWKRLPEATPEPAVEVDATNADPSARRELDAILAGLDRGRRETRGLGLLGINQKTSLAPIVVGFVATAIECNPELTRAELDEALTTIGEESRLGGGNALARKWQTLLGT